MTTKINAATGEINETKQKKGYEITLRPNGSRRVRIHNSDPVITDQAAAQDLTMLSIVKKLENGIMPRFNEGLIYSTDLGLRNLQDVVERKKQVDDLFYQLPIEIRNVMQHDLSNFEKVLFDPKNSELLAKHGLITEKRDNHMELLNAIKSISKPSPDEQKPVESR